MPRLALVVLAVSTFACAPGAPHDALTPVLIGLLVILAAAKVGGELAVRGGQPAVLGELVVGIFLGGLIHLGVPLPDIAHARTFQVLASLGVVVLLFEVGLESTVSELLAIGGRATLVATVGVVGVVVGGTVLGMAMLPGHSFVRGLFIGGAVCGTSVGITARVLRDLRQSSSKAAKIILGAAVVDDVLALVVLSLVTGIAVGTAGGHAFDWRLPLRSGLLAIAFLSSALVLGPRVSRWIFRISTRMRSPDLLLPIALAFAFGVAAIAGYVQLAPIVGAFAAGLTLDRAEYRTLIDRGEHELEDLIRPVGQVLTPIFFVVMGARVELWRLGSLNVWLLTGALVALTLVTRLVLGLAAPKGTSKLTLALGMIPRGEVTLIFADVGRRLILQGKPFLSADEFSAIVFTVAATSLMTPPLLRLQFGRQR